MLGIVGVPFSTSEMGETGAAVGNDDDTLAAQNFRHLSSKPWSEGLQLTFRQAIAWGLVNFASRVLAIGEWPVPDKVSRAKSPLAAPSNLL